MIFFLKDIYNPHEYEIHEIPPIKNGHCIIIAFIWFPNLIETKHFLYHVNGLSKNYKRFKIY